MPGTDSRDQRAGVGYLAPVMACSGALVGLTLIIHAAVTAPTAPPQPPPAAASPLRLGQHTPTAGSTTSGAGIAALPRSTPLSVAIRRTGLRTDVIALGKNPDGTIAVPSGPQAKDAAWYNLGPTPGEPGPAVIVGHVDYLGLPQGRAAFFTLGATRPGDQIDITRADGTTATFTVDSVQRVAKTHFPTQAVYGPLTYPGLRLITCGGTFTKTGGYTDNIIVFAHLTAVSTHDGRNHD